MRTLLSLTLLLATLFPADLFAHCEVPCGVYGDQRRFESMLEDVATIAKAMAQIEALAGKTDALSVNQRVRWVNTKEEHAKAIQHVVAQYFLTQRIKASNERYVEQLKAAHALMVQAMKCKQKIDAKCAEHTKQAIYALYKAYEGKDPVFHKDHK